MNDYFFLPTRTPQARFYHCHALVCRQGNAEGEAGEGLRGQAREDTLQGAAPTERGGRARKRGTCRAVQCSSLPLPLRSFPLTQSSHVQPAISEAERKAMMAHYFKKQQEQKKLAEDDEDDYLHSSWADSGALQSGLRGVGNIKAPGIR